MSRMSFARRSGLAGRAGSIEETGVKPPFPPRPSRVNSTSIRFDGGFARRAAIRSDCPNGQRGFPERQCRADATLRTIERDIRPRRRAMFRHAARAWSLGLLLAAGGCATGPTIESNYDHTANFGAYRTFGYFSPLGTDKTGYSSLVTQELKNATRREMEARGYAYSETAPDLLLNF